MAVSNNLATWQNALVSTFEAATGIKWYWENEAAGHRLFPYGIFSGPDAVNSVGVDWVQYNKTTPGMAVPEVIGFRTVNIGARVITISQTPGQKAYVFLETARMALYRPQRSDTWSQIGMSLASASSIRLMDAKQDNRMESIASLTLGLNIKPDTLIGGVDLGIIEHVQISSTGFPTNLTNEIISEEEFLIDGPDILGDEEDLMVTD